MVFHIANDFDIGKDNHQTLPDWLNGLFTCCVIKHNIHGDDDANYRHMMLWHISIFCHLLEECSSAVMSQQMKSYIFHHTKFCQVRKTRHACMYVHTHLHSHTNIHTHAHATHT